MERLERSLPARPVLFFTIEMKFLSLLFLFLILNGALGGVALAADKTVMAEVQKLLDSEEQTRQRLDNHLIESLKGMQSTNAASTNADLLETALSRKESQIENNQSALLENHLRIEFLNEFISALESSSNPRTDSSNILLDLAHKDLLAAVENQSNSKTWLFEIYLSIALRDIMEPSENFGDFLKKFIVYSSLHDPKPPSGFMSGRSYIGATEDKAKSKDDSESTDDPETLEFSRHSRPSSP